jgi:putative ATP-binding cassette transporter
MKRKHIVNHRLTIIIGFILMSSILLSSMKVFGENGNSLEKEQIEKKVTELMDTGDIPGLTLVIVKEGVPPYIKGFGYADPEEMVPVTSDTLFQLGSCTKAYTALGALYCQQEGFFSLDESISRYLPWFYLNHEGKKIDITLRQALEHTSGIPFNSISRIPEGDQSGALEQTVRNIVGIELDSAPGKQFQYATVNYDIVGAVIEKVTQMSFEDFMLKNILNPLELHNTYVGVSSTREVKLPKAKGHKIGFYKARPFQAPIYKGNTPAGYIISNGKDMARWLEIQMGMQESEFQTLIQESHKRNEKIPPNRANLSSYSMGWQTYLDGSGMIDHSGANPNFTAYIGFNPKEKIGVAVLANSNSSVTTHIGKHVLSVLKGEVLDVTVPYDGLDKGSSVLCFILALYLLAVIIFLISIGYELFKGSRRFQSFTLWKLVQSILFLLVFIPFILALYFVPKTMAGVDMNTALVWSPLSFQVAIIMVLISMGISYIGIILSLLFPQENKYKRAIPLAVVLSLLSGGSNAVVIFLITTSIFSNTPLFYQLYNFMLAFVVYIAGRKVIQTKLIKVTFDIVYDMRMKLVEKIFYTSYQKFEKLDRGRVFATLNDDTGQIGNSANVFVQLVTSFITIICAFVYLATIAFWATVVTLIVIGMVATLYGVVSQKAQVYLEEARDTRNVYMGLLNGLLDGFKELSIRFNKKMEYKKDISESCDEFRIKSSIALVKFVNAFLIGESLLIVILGSVGFGIPRLFPGVSNVTLMGFIMVLLYLIGPINGILNSIPQLIQLKVSWNRVKEFIDDIPANLKPAEIKSLEQNVTAIDSIKARGLVFEYRENDEDENLSFSIGPMDLEAKKGEIIFVIGGNGSGKTTLAKLLTGLYFPNKGEIKVNGKVVNSYQLGEYYSAVFGDYHLFEKLYDVDLDGKEEKIQKYLKLLNLEEKVKLEDNAFSTIDLSGGQRKRLALLQCYLEDSPVYLFDEIAADQDPEFRKFFYRELLPEMKKSGKIIIAITHDDHYFDVADKVIKMDMGRIDIVQNREQFSVTS